MKKAWVIPIQKKPKKRLQIELYTYGETALVGKILSQDESLRGVGDVVLTEDDFRIISYSCPELSEDTLFIRGTEKYKDNTHFSMDFGCEEDMDIFLNKLKRAIDELNGEIYTKTDVREVFTRVI